jgi:6-phosphogluconolactonase
MRIKLFLLLLLASTASIAQSFYMFIGTYTDKGSKGIYVYRFNASTGKANMVSNTEGVENPSYLAIASNNKYVYAVNENAGHAAGVSAFSFDSSTGKLSLINKQFSGGDHPCYVTVSKNNNWVLAGNYSGGNLTAFKTNADGSINPYNQLVQHSGAGSNKSRQEKAHVHSTVFSPDEKYVFAADLGMDKVMIYKFNGADEKPLQESDPSYLSTEPGSGPRHFTFHPNKNFAYLIEELSGEVQAYKYQNGNLTSIQRIATHPPGYKGAPGSADIHISPDGNFLYASNRGDENNIAIFSINKKTGLLKAKGTLPTGGKTPRNFIIDPTGKYLLVANQGTDNIVVFKRNQTTGMLQKTGEEMKVSKPVCIQLMK